MTDQENLPHADDRSIFIADLLDERDRLERENLDLRRDLSTTREMLTIALDKLRAALQRDRYKDARIRALTTLAQTVRRAA